MKRLFSLSAAMLLLLIIFSGCGRMQSDISKMNVILALGIDGAPHECNISVRVFEASADESGEAKTTVYKSSGDTLPAALDSLTAAIGNEPLLSQSSLIIFGREAAEAGIDEALEFIFADDYIGPSAVVAVADGTAEDIMSAKSLDNFLPTDRFGNMVLAAWRSGTGVDSDFIGTVTASANKFSDFCLPVIRIDESKHIVTDSTAVFAGGSLIGDINAEEVLGLLILKNDVSGGQLRITDESGLKYVFEIISSQTELETRREGDSIKAAAKIHTSLRLEHSDGAYNGKETAEEFEEIARREIERLVNASYNKIIKEMKSDPVNIGRSLLASGDIKDESKEKFAEMLASSNIEVEITADLSRIEFVRR